MTHLRELRVIALLAAAALTVVACGDDAGDGAPAATSTPATTGPAATTTVPADTTPASTSPAPITVAPTTVAPTTEPAGPRVVSHALGETELVGDPRQVVVLDSSFLDATIALGVTPIGATAGVSPGVLPPYLDAFVDGGIAAIGDAGMTTEPNLEAIATMHPDLILCAKVRHEAIYDQLSQIAPTVCSESSGTDWTAQVRLTGEALGLAADADQLLADFDARAAAVGAAIGADGQTARIVRFIPGQTRVYGEPTFSGSVLTAVGFDVTGDAALEWHPEFGMALVAAEQFELLDADVIFATTLTEGSDRTAFQSVWSVLPAVAEGRQFDIDDDIWFTGIGVLGANLILDDLESWLG